MRLAWIVAGAFLVLLAVFHQPILRSVLGHQSSKRAAVVGEKVPEFTVTDVSGKSWTLAELRKRTESGVVCLTFWCTFCHSCRMMDARFATLNGDFKDKAAVLGIDASAADTAEKVQDFARAKKFSVPIFLDAEGKAADLFGVRVTTTTVVIDKEGILRYWGHFGTEEKPHARDALKAVVEGKEVPVKETTPSG